MVCGVRGEATNESASLTEGSSESAVWAGTEQAGVLRNYTTLLDTHIHLGIQ